MRQRKSNPGFVVDRLQRKHSDLAYRVEALDNRVHLSDQDQAELGALKREKLATKDALDALRRDP
jgi:hypothetical protein